MIRNLNPAAFQAFGMVPLIKTQESKSFDKNASVIQELSLEETQIFRAESDTWVTRGNGMSVLTVSLDGTQFQHFYLDKPACIRKGVLFALNAMRSGATALLSAQTEPVPVGSRTLDSLRVEPKLKADCIYTFFYQEQEEGFLFPGEAHPVAELTYVDRGPLHSVVDGQELVLEQGDLVLYGPDQWHMQYADIGVAPRHVTISFDVRGMDLTPLLNKKLPVTQTVVSVLKAMLREQERMDAYSNDIILAQLKLLLLVLLREAEEPRGGKLQTPMRCIQKTRSSGRPSSMYPPTSGRS